MTQPLTKRLATEKKLSDSIAAAAPLADPGAGVPGTRTLGSGATQAASGSDARFSGYRSVLAATASLTAATAQIGALTVVTSSSATTVTLPTPLSLGAAAGQVMTVQQGGSGQVTVAAGTGVSLVGRKVAATFLTAGQYAGVDAIALNDTTWWISGDLA